LRSKSVDGAQKGSAARNVTETKFIWKNRKLKRPYKRSFLIQMALDELMKWCHLFVRHQGKIAVKFEILSIKKL
jgi:hypothetical protein